MVSKPYLTFLKRGSRIPFILTVAGMAGVPAFFLSFVADISPSSVSLDMEDLFELWRLAWPFFLPILVTIASLRWHISTKLSLPERITAYCVSAGMVCMILIIYVPGDLPDMLQGWIGFSFPLLILPFGVFTLLRARKNATFKSYRPIMTMQTAYLANSLFCLTITLGEWQIGAYCSLVTTVAYLIQIVYVGYVLKNDHNPS